MKKHCSYLIAIAGLLLCVLVSTTSAQQETGVAVVVNQENPINSIAVVVNPDNPITSISAADLRRIFAGDKQSWSNNLPVFPVVRASGAREREVLLAKVLKMSEQEYKHYWLQKVYSGEAHQEPVALFSNGMQLEAVRAKKGAIALISAQDVREGVKVIKVDGYTPGTPGYSFK